eukprot:SAG31_NODE_1094_length_9945_cov_3.834349_14_plen_49_part_00
MLTQQPSMIVSQSKLRRLRIAYVKILLLFKNIFKPLVFGTFMCCSVSL